MSIFSITREHAFDNIHFFKENSEDDYSQCIQSLIMSKPFGDNKFYIYSFIKRVDDASGIKKYYHQPRLTKPDPIPGTTLMRVDPRNPYEATIIWTLPNQENFGLYSVGKMFSDPFVHECVEKYLKNPRDLVRKEPDDLTEEQIREIYKDLHRQAKMKRREKENAQASL